MKDLCHDVFGVAKEKKDPREVKSNRGNISFCLNAGNFIQAPFMCIFVIVLVMKCSTWELKTISLNSIYTYLF